MSRLTQKYTTILLKELIEYKFDNRDADDLVKHIKDILVDFEDEVILQQKQCYIKNGF